MRGCLAAFAAALLAAAPAIAGSLTLDGDFAEGGLVRAVAAPGTRVTLDGQAVPVAPDGRFLLGFGRDAPATAELVLLLSDGTREERRLAVAQRSYAVQRIDGLPRDTVTPDPATLERIKREAAEVRAARAEPSEEGGFEERLVWPVRGPLSGLYGSQRILDGEPHAPHLGVDIAAPAGTPVVAAASGIVRLAAPLFLTGNTVIIDHGGGLTTTYAHLSRMDVAVGRRVKQGEEIGAVGATGRATGPNLHWGVEWLGTRLDPQLAAGPMKPE